MLFLQAFPFHIRYQATSAPVSPRTLQGQLSAYDIPYNFIYNHFTKSPIFSGRKYIQIDFKQGITLASCCPMYIRENFTPEQIQSANFSFPKYAQIKFSDKNADMDKSYQFLQTGIRAKEYELSHKPKQKEDNPGGFNPNYLPPQPKVTGLGMDRVKNMMRGKLETQQQMIQGAFTDINSLRQNAEQMIAIASQIRSKIANNPNNKSENDEINSVLSKIGFIDPITKEVAGSEYYVKLGEQITIFHVVLDFTLSWILAKIRNMKKNKFNLKFNKNNFKKK